MPTPPVPKQLPVPKKLPANKDTGVVDQSKGGEIHTGTRAKKDTQSSHLPPPSLMHKPSVIPITGMSMAMPYHHSHAPVHFGVPNPQIQPRSMSTSLQMPLPIGNAAQMQHQMQHQVFVPSLQPHSVHPQGIMHQGQSMGFTPQIGHQMAHQLGNIGMSINPQYSPQQGGKYAAPRKTTPVKITHPDTHEELRLDKRANAYSDGGSSGARPHSGIPSQSPPVQSFPASHPISYYQPNSPFYQTPSSLPLSNSQITPTTQPPRLNYTVNRGPQNVGFANSVSHNSLPVNKTVASISGIVEPPNREFSRDVPNAISSTVSGASYVSTKPSGSGVVISSFSDSISSAKKDGSPNSVVTSSDASSSLPPKESGTCSEISSQQSTVASSEKLTSASLLPSSSVLSKNMVSDVSKNEGKNKESLSRSNSLKDNQKKGQLQHQVQKC